MLKEIVYLVVAPILVGLVLRLVDYWLINRNNNN